MKIMNKNERDVPDENGPFPESRETQLTQRILSDLVRIPSYVDGQHNEEQLADYIEGLVREDGYYRIERQLVVGRRANLIIHDGTPPKVILFGHLDTVEPSSEMTDPFGARIEGDKLHGLGAADMKAGLAIAISSALRLKTPGLALIFTVDEEYKFKGAEKLVEKYHYNPRFVINLEATDCEILSGCRGITEFTLQVHGRTCHAGRKELGINAIERTYLFVRELEERLKKWNLPEARNSLNFAGIKGGAKVGEKPDGTPIIKETPNKVADIAIPLLEIRLANPQMKKDDLEKLIAEIADTSKIDFDSLKIPFFYGSMFTPKEELKPFEEAILRSGLPIKYQDINASGFFEVQMLQERWGGNIVVFGPGPSSTIHTANEYVDISSLRKAQETIDNFLTLCF